MLQIAVCPDISLPAQALAAVARHYPDVWLEFALWHSRTAVGGGGKDAALTVLDRGTKVLHIQCLVRADGLQQSFDL